MVVPDTPARLGSVRPEKLNDPFAAASLITRVRDHVVPEPVHEPDHVPLPADSEGADSNDWFAVTTTVYDCPVGEEIKRAGEPVIVIAAVGAVSAIEIAAERVAVAPLEALVAVMV